MAVISSKWILAITGFLAATALLSMACGASDGGVEAQKVSEQTRATTLESGQALVDPKAPVVDVSLTEFSMTVNVATAGAGPVTFSVTNTGVAAHEFMIMKSDALALKFPAEGVRVTDGTSSLIVGTIDDVAPGETAAKTFDLAPGTYDVLLCDLDDHYQAGMHAQFTATSASVAATTALEPAQAATPVAPTAEPAAPDAPPPAPAADAATPTPTEAPPVPTVAPTPAPPQPVDVNVTLSEFKIDSSLTTFQVGVPYHFTVTNKGVIPHEINLANLNGAEIPVGATKTLDVTFTQQGPQEFACHLPSHYQAGMKLAVVIS